ncbi:transporter [Vibrio sp. qd031]|uniref:lipoprotein-releasing ABC transporter permease subunit LolC n=1 Tax=Vibrio sp. qd031 TaxID=1603038 RepID=UPI000A0F5A7D|nr:lipoprotein-releasing ABC transporter permease subunit LolC [Vibrio sp. qd031]ORT50127.1 transporter [Vibrio sp. qd031]
MFQPLSLFIGLRYLRGRSGDRFSRFVSSLSTAGITIGVMALVAVLSVMNGFETQLKGRILSVSSQAIISQDANPITVSESAKQAVPLLGGVSRAEAVIESEAVLQSSSKIAAIKLVAVDDLKNDPSYAFMMSPPFVEWENGSYQLVLGHLLARQLQVRVGDKIKLILPSASRFTPLGRMPAQRNFVVSGIINTGSEADRTLAMTHRQDLAKLMRYKPDQAQGWRLYFEDSFNVSNIATQYQAQGWQWQDWRNDRGELFQAVRMEKNMMGLMLGLIVAVAAFNIISALIMVVMEKESEVAILKTQGLTSGKVMSIFMVQGASSGVIGALIGGALGVALALQLNTILQFFDVPLFAYGGSLPVAVSSSQVLIVIIGAIALSIAATLFPSYRASQVKPAEALRYE